MCAEVTDIISSDTYIPSSRYSILKVNFRSMIALLENGTLVGIEVNRNYRYTGRIQ